MTQYKIISIPDKGYELLIKIKKILANSSLDSSADLNPCSQDLTNSTNAIKGICKARGLVFDSSLFNDHLPNTQFANNLCIFFSTKISDSVLKNLPSEIRASLAKVLLTIYDESKQNSLGEKLRQIITSLSQNPSESTSTQDIGHSFLLLNHMDSAISTILKEGKASGNIGSYIKTQLDYLITLWGETITSNKADSPGYRDFPTAIKAIIHAGFKSKDPVEREAIKTALIEWIKVSIPKMNERLGKHYLLALRVLAKYTPLFKGDYKFQSRFMETIGKSEILLSHQNIDAKTTSTSPFFSKIASALLDFILKAGEDKNVRHDFFSQMSRELTETCEPKKIMRFLLNVLTSAFEEGRDKKGIELALLTWIETAIPRMTSEISKQYLEILNTIVKDKTLFKGHAKCQNRIMVSLKDVATIQKSVVTPVAAAVAMMY